MDFDYFIDKKRATALIIVVAVISSIGWGFYTHPGMFCGGNDFGFEVRTYSMYSDDSYNSFYSQFFGSSPSSLGFVMVSDIRFEGYSNNEINFIFSFTEGSLDAVVFTYRDNDELIFGENGLMTSSYSRTYPFNSRGYRVYLFFRDVNIENIEIDVMVI